MNEPTSAADPPIWLIVLIPIAFLIIFPLYWCFVVWLIAKLGGWSRLAKRYRTEEAPEGTLHGSVSARIGLASYNGMLSCVTNEFGLFLKPMVLFRCGHPPLFIPWSEFHDARKSQFLWQTLVRATIGNPRVARIAIQAKVFAETPVPGDSETS